MTALVITHPIFAQHLAGVPHPESTARIEAVWRTLRDDAFAPLQWREAPAADRTALELVHNALEIESVLDAVPQEGIAALDADTLLSPQSVNAALRAVGAVTSAVDQVMTGDVRHAFCAVRPPGHHAEPGRAMGFCLFNSIAIGARHAQTAHGLEKIAIVDFDVHHGNGTQAAFARDTSVFFASTHQHPLYPGTGMADERGVGNILNLPLPPGTAGAAYRRHFERTILPALDDFAPDLLLVSAGFDAHRSDPLAQLELEESDFAWITERLTEVAARHCKGRLVSVLEGGYDLRGLSDSVAAHMRMLMRPA